MSNPFYMYDIFSSLNKIQDSVKPEPEVLKESAAPAKTETPTTRLDEKYMGWNKTVAAIKKGGSAENPEAVAAAIGRKKYGKKKFQAAAAKGKKLGEGSKPDFLDLDKDGNKTEPMKTAAKEKVKESKCMECGMWESKCGCDKEQVDEYFYFDDKPKKDRVPRDHGHDELERRGKLGKNPLVKHGKEYKGKGDNYKIAGPKGHLPEADMEEGNAFAEKVLQAKKDGIQKGEKIKVGGKEYPLREKLSSGEMKAFAALAEPKNKVTYADKIAGAKKRGTKMHEQDMEEARSTKGTAFDPEYMKKVTKDKKVTASGRHDISKSAAGGTVYSKRFKDEEEGEEDTKSTGEKRRGRPKKYSDEKPRQERVTAKSRKKDRTAHGQSGFTAAKKKKHVDEMGYGGLTHEDQMMGPDHGEYDREGDMARDQLHTIVKAAKELHGILSDEQNLPEWVQTKITKALDYINASRDYMDQEESDMDDAMLGEKAVSQQQQKFMGMVHAMQKGGKVKGASPELKKTARTMKKSDAEDFAKTKHKGLPKKVKGGKPVEEDGGPGGIDAEKPYRDEKGKMVTPPKGATNPPQDPVSPAKPARSTGKKSKDPEDSFIYKPRADADTTNDEQVAETDKNPTDSASKKAKSGGGMTFGKGIYDSMNRDLESMIAENMNVTVNASSEGDKNITVNATEEDADALARLLMMAGLESPDTHGDTCPSCGSQECECDMVDEAVSNNEPDYPENMDQTQDTDFMVNTISGGLNRRKADITTLPATRVRAMEESAAASLWQRYNNHKAN